MPDKGALFKTVIFQNLNDTNKKNPWSVRLGSPFPPPFFFLFPFFVKEMYSFLFIPPSPPLFFEFERMFLVQAEGGGGGGRWKGNTHVFGAWTTAPFWVGGGERGEVDEIFVWNWLEKMGILNCGRYLFSSPPLSFPIAGVGLGYFGIPTANSLLRFCHFRPRSGNKEAKEVQGGGRLFNWTVVKEGFLASDKRRERWGG